MTCLIVVTLFLIESSVDIISFIIYIYILIIINYICLTIVKKCYETYYILRKKKRSFIGPQVFPKLWTMHSATSHRIMIRFFNASPIKITEVIGPLKWPDEIWNLIPILSTRIEKSNVKDSSDDKCHSYSEKGSRICLWTIYGTVIMTHDFYDLFHYNESL